MNFLYKMERKFGKYAVRNLSLILVLCYAAGYIIELINEDVIYKFDNISGGIAENEYQ